MEKKEIAKWLIRGAVIGVIVILTIGFGFGRWVLDSTAQKKAEQMVMEAVMELSVPICVAQFQQDPNRTACLEELKKIDSWIRDEYVEKHNWATMPGQEEPNGEVARECAKRIVELE